MSSRKASLFICNALLGVGLSARIARRRAPAQMVHERSTGMMTSAQAVEDWTVVFKPETTSAQIQELCGSDCMMTGHPTQGGVPFAEFHGSEAEVMERLSTHTDKIAFIEPEVLENALPDDTRSEVSAAATPWGLDRVGVPRERSGRGRGSHIYIVDTGVMATHKDFDGRAVPTLDTSEGEPTECAKDDVSCAADGNGHGTHCAGTAAGKTYGVADAATVHGVKCVNDNGRAFQSWVFLALDWIAVNAQKPAVVSVSLQFNGESWSMETAVAAVTRAGIAVVVAAGNVNNWSCDFSPAYVPEAITVGATNQVDAKAEFSNFGRCNNIWAPGVDITSAFNEGDDSSTTWSGTSMATPHVAGAAALLLEIDPTLTRDQIMERLQSLGETGVISGLRANDPDLMLSVAEMAPTTPPTPAPSSPTPAPPAGACPWHGCIFGCGGDKCQFCDRC